VPARVRDEEGFGLIELAFAMVMLNIAILALVAAFNAGAVAVRRAAATSNGTAVADKVMETYRDLKNDAIYLSAPTTPSCNNGGADAGGWPNGIPNSTSTWYSQYSGNTTAYSSALSNSYYSYSTPSSSPQWVTGCTTSGGSTSPIPSTVTTDVPSGLAVDPTKAVQQVAGPDGQNYTVFSYVVMVPVTSGGYVKQVTIYVYDPRNSTNVLAMEQSLFDPSVSP